MRILLVEDEHKSREFIADFLKELGHQVVESANGQEALEAFCGQEFHIVLSDIRMPKMSGLELLRNIKRLPQGENVDVVLFTGHGELQSSIEALRAGAYDYLLKPINIDELVKVTERVAEHQALRRENEVLSKNFNDAVQEATKETQEELTRLREAYSQTVGLGNVGIFSAAMKNVWRQARRLHGDRTVPVLITGETGTGKEIVVKYIHYGEGGEISPFIAINCTAITPNMFESELFGYEAGSFTGGLSRGKKGKLDLAQSGTLLLDEISEIPVDLQAKLLRVIQEKEYYRVGGLKKIRADIRVVCATNVDLEAKLKEGTFRRDLYYRLNVGQIHLPPLRERSEDIIPLANLFLTEFSREKRKLFQTISHEAEDILLSYQWPGNVRELKNVVEWAVLMYDDLELKPEHLGSLAEQKQATSVATEQIGTNNFILPPDSFPIKDFIRKVIYQALQMHNGNKKETAKYLGISRRSLYYQLERLQN